ncbi:MAG: lytic transglycosylase domain-containing protein, partial [Clostridium sp.]|nr:lytic transglycosylase domain-containing protein [Clostridium sp.]
KYGVDKNLVLAIIKHESNFDPNVVSSAGAKGLMQLMDFNSEAYGLTNPFDIDQNINAGVQHIKSYLDLYDGNVELALMAYNAGPGTVSRRGVNSIDDLYKMPQETQNYVTKIMKQLNGN